jgi:hypothetical protein
VASQTELTTADLMRLRDRLRVCYDRANERLSHLYPVPGDEQFDFARLIWGRQRVLAELEQRGVV